MIEEFKLEKFIRPKRIYSKLGISLLDHIYDLEETTAVIDGGFVSISTPEPVNKRRADYLRRFGVNARIGKSGDQVLTFHQTSVDGIIRLARRPWVKRIEISHQLHMLGIVSSASGPRFILDPT